MLKGMKTLVVEETREQNTTQFTVLHFMMEHLQQEVQQDLRNHQGTVAGDHGHLSQKMDHCIRMMDKIGTSLGSLEAYVSQGHREQDGKMQALDNKIDTCFAYTNSLLSRDNKNTYSPFHFSLHFSRTDLIQSYFRMSLQYWQSLF